MQETQTQKPQECTPVTMQTLQMAHQPATGKYEVILYNPLFFRRFYILILWYIRLFAGLKRMLRARTEYTARTDQELCIKVGEILEFIRVYEYVFSYICMTTACVLIFSIFS